ncbi:S-layer homology domain-containing protein [Sporosarcina koreensis]|uniref:S-layer homology domain-containing protein n=1 Tax=Sporosarcina koreensis TaxID=334735 RepID=UPI000ABB3C8E|nr:S-layer homology domain-containing protein [Sporosarcina koreensis]
MKKFGSFLLSFALVLGIISPSASAATNFSDVNKSTSFYSEIQFLVDAEIISGYYDGTFKPQKNVTRGEAAIMIGRMMELDGTKRATKFKDVPASHSGSGYIASAVSEKVISGYPDGTFRPNQQISRGDMAIILANAFDLNFRPHYTFSDVTSRMKAYGPVLALAAESITTGYANGTFKPNDNVTRGQFSAFLARGLSPVYKQKAALAGGYAQNMTKQYTYAEADGDVVHTYKYIDGTINGMPLGFMWEAERMKDGATVQYMQFENRDSLASGLPYSDISIDLKYPATLHKSWKSYGNSNDYETITKVNTTVTTPYKTFTNAIEVKGSSGYKSYYVPNVGQVKTIDPSGKTVSQLKSIK